MQLTKLLTLSQFIDEIAKSTELDYCTGITIIFDYNNFLKQPTTKEMFVGDMAIFDGWKECAYIKGSVNHPNEIDWITFHIDYTDYNGEFKVDTLFDLSEATNGTLTLKNVTI